MIHELRGKYKGANIAVLGSGPTVNMYKEKEDLAIAVNGAALIDRKYDIFMAGDFTSPTMEWWETEASQRIMSSYISVFDPFMYPDKGTRTRLQDELDSHIAENKDEKYPYVGYYPQTRPKKPHLFFRFGGFGKEYVDFVSPNQVVMYWGGTISAIALQASLVMGCESINIYGCGFNNQSGTNYHYDCPEGQGGSISDEQIRIMQATLDKVRSYGVHVKVHGESNIS